MISEKASRQTVRREEFIEKGKESQNSPKGQSTGGICEDCNGEMVTRERKGMRGGRETIWESSHTLTPHMGHQMKGQ